MPSNRDDVEAMATSDRAAAKRQVPPSEGPAAGVEWDDDLATMPVMLACMTIGEQQALGVVVGHTIEKPAQRQDEKAELEADDVRHWTRHSRVVSGPTGSRVQGLWRSRTGAGRW